MVSLLIRAQVWLVYWLGRLVLRVPGHHGNQPIDLEQVRRVLVIRPDEIGDLVLASPFLRELRLLLPDAWITLVVNPVTRELVDQCPYVNEVRVYDQRISRRWRPLIMPWRALKLASHWFRSPRFDLALVPRWDTDAYYSAFLAYLSCATWRLGYSERVNVRKQNFNRGFDCLLTHTLHDCNPKHEVERSLDFVRYLGGMPQDGSLELWLTSENEAFADRVSGLAFSPVNPIVAFGVGAGRAVKIWPIERFIALGAWLEQNWQASILVVGGRAEQALGRQLAEALGVAVTDMTGRTTLRQTAALLKRCHLYVGNDAGPKHLAAAAGIPIVEISSFPGGDPGRQWNSPSRFSSWGVPNRMVHPEKGHPPCHDACNATEPHCIRNVTVEQVQRAVAGMLVSRN